MWRLPSLVTEMICTTHSEAKESLSWRHIPAVNAEKPFRKGGDVDSHFSKLRDCKGHNKLLRVFPVNISKQHINILEKITKDKCQQPKLSHLAITEKWNHWAFMNTANPTTERERIWPLRVVYAERVVHIPFQSKFRLKSGA